MTSRKSWILVLVGCSLLFGKQGAALEPQESQDKKEKDEVVQVIGTYDSRSVAIAFCATDLFNQQLASMIKPYREAEKSGDDKKIEAAKQAITKYQQQLHQQAFGTQPVTNILKLYAKQVQRIRKKENLDHLISKWDKKQLKKYPEVKQVDITMKLIDMIEPNDKQRKSAIEIQKHEPIDRSKKVDARHHAE